MSSRRFSSRRFSKNETGSVFVEFTLIVFFLLVVTGGIIDFGVALYQWNAATKAMQQGARLAAVSDPVASDLKAMTGLEGGASAGAAFPAFTRVCSGASASCSGGTYSATAMNTLVYGRSETTCGTVAASQLAGMCDMFNRISPANVIVTYTQTGLGFAGRPGGPVPTITLELSGLTFTLPFLNSLLRMTPLTIPPMRTSATGEDMCTQGLNSAGRCP
jgi:Flp pilus assembly protein TadG